MRDLSICVFIYLRAAGGPHIADRTLCVLLATAISKIYNAPDIKGHQRERNTPLMQKPPLPGCDLSALLQHPAYWIAFPTIIALSATITFSI